jgi:formylglycine-generating enzyme required for sulfatase activity
MSFFEIEIDRSASTYRVAARGAAGESGWIPAQFPYKDHELQTRLANLQDAVLSPAEPVRRTLSRGEEGEDTVQDFGNSLFDFAFPPKLRALYAASAQLEPHSTLRLRITPPELAALPWEFLYDADGYDYLALSTPVVRYLDVPKAPRELISGRPLRILAMAASPRNLPALDVDHERRRLADALSDLVAKGLVELSWVPGQTWWDLQKALDGGPWHMFHFIGHGAMDKPTGQGVLAFTAENGGRSENIVASDIALLLAGHQDLRIAMINACESARGSPLNGFSSVASAIVQRGIPAAVAMQYEITDEAAISFARGFYEGIASKLPVEQAVTRARRAMKIAHSGSLEWVTPVLYLRARTGDLFDIDPPQIPKTGKPGKRRIPLPSRRGALRIACGLGAAGVLGTGLWEVRDRQKLPSPHPVDVDLTTVDEHGVKNAEQPQSVDVFDVPLGGTALSFSVIPAGSFLIGSPEQELERRLNEGPQKRIEIRKFALGRTTVTQAQWLALYNLLPSGTQTFPYNPSSFLYPDHPIETISWDQATEFCRRLSEKVGLSIRLPSESEWEYACRAGTETPFHYGPTITPELANYCGTGEAVRGWSLKLNVTAQTYEGMTYTSGAYADGPPGTFKNGTVAVGTYPANGFGLYEMHGNVWEHCFDPGPFDYSTIPANGNPAGGQGDSHVLRGGSWSHNPAICRSAYRDSIQAGSAGWAGRVGLRLACDLD